MHLAHRQNLSFSVCKQPIMFAISVYVLLFVHKNQDLPSFILERETERILSFYRGAKSKGCSKTKCTNTYGLSDNFSAVNINYEILFILER
jgi:hypothetical protein